MGFDCCPVIRCQVCKQVWQIQIWGDSWREREWATLRSDRLPSLPSYTRWDRWPISVSHCDMYTCFALIGSWTSGLSDVATLLPALIGVPLLDTHQNWQPPMLRHPPSHQSVSTGGVHPAADQPTFPLTVRHMQRARPSQMHLPILPSVPLCTWLSTVPAATWREGPRFNTLWDTLPHTHSQPRQVHSNCLHKTCYCFRRFVLSE